MALIRLGTRGSQLALTQSETVASQLRELGHDVDLIVLKTTGDVRSGSLQNFGGQGVFTQRLQQALLENEIDLAVHSLKDLPTRPTEGLVVAAVPQREETRDALILPKSSGKATSIDDLFKGATVGTGSNRRKAQLLHLRPDLVVQDIRGNVDTRLEKLDSGQYDAILLACAGLNRLQLQNRISFPLPLNSFAPAVGQGALGLEARASDQQTINSLKPLNHSTSYSTAFAERALLNSLQAGCLAPVGAVSVVDGPTLSLSGVVFSEDGKTKIQASATAPMEQAIRLGKHVADLLIEKGAEQYIVKR